MLKWTFTHIRLAAIIQIMIAVAFLAWALIIWVNVDTFGSSPECNANVKYVVVFFSVRATASWLRKLWIILLGISAGGMVMVIIIAIFLTSSWWARWKSENEEVFNLLRAWYKYVLWLQYSVLMRYAPFSLALACRKVKLNSCTSFSGVGIVMLEAFVRTPPTHAWLQ
jgi:hypothetical protein